VGVAAVHTLDDAGGVLELVVVRREVSRSGCELVKRNQDSVD
jgi:hypothetical protein